MAADYNGLFSTSCTMVKQPRFQVLGNEVRVVMHVCILGVVCRVESGRKYVKNIQR